MYNYKSSAELKRMAREQLAGKYPVVIGAELIYLVIFTAIILFTTFTLPLNTVAGNIFYYGITFLSQLLGGVFWVGKSCLYLNVVTGKSYKASDIFFGFHQNPNKAITITFFITLLTDLFLLPYYILSTVHNVTALTAEMYIAFLAAYLIGNIFVTYISICYALRFYLMLDMPDYGAIETLKLSYRFMKGHRLRYLYINLSFLPLILLGLFSCGIGMLWIAPYINATTANFYLDLMQGQNANNVQQKREC